jgi:hypothetical protein
MWKKQQQCSGCDACNAWQLRVVIALNNLFKLKTLLRGCKGLRGGVNEDERHEHAKLS